MSRPYPLVVQRMRWLRGIFHRGSSYYAAEAYSKQTSSITQHLHCLTQDCLLSTQVWGEDTVSLFFSVSFSYSSSFHAHACTVCTRLYNTSRTCNHSRPSLPVSVCSSLARSTLACSHRVRNSSYCSADLESLATQSQGCTRKSLAILSGTLSHSFGVVSGV